MDYRQEKICGYLQIAKNWFKEDYHENGTNESRLFIFTYKDGQIEYNQEFREFWKDCIKPLYVSRSDDNQNINYFDFKSNPRRCHPFVQYIIYWYSQMKNFINNSSFRCIPFLIIKDGIDIDYPENWRLGFSENDIYNIRKKYIFNGNYGIRYIQRNWKYKNQYKKCVRQIDNEVAYRFGKSKMIEVMEHFYSVISKKILY